MLIAAMWRAGGLATCVAQFVLLAVRPWLLAVWVVALSSKLVLAIVPLVV